MAAILSRPQLTVVEPIGRLFLHKWSNADEYGVIDLTYSQRFVCINKTKHTDAGSKRYVHIK